MVPSLGTWAEKQRTPTERSEINHLNIIMAERTRPVEIERKWNNPPHRIRNHRIQP